ncbi:ras-related protein Rab-17 isoform X2 [Myotis myotis]|uniref:Ras-related protein Rab-17 n=1 Tax=Myotis myotis TaxID=51298 RepID=A0A7J7WIT3_MYOMY|nr:ras-related protein Rab-17 isoform X2 [Myotis myotis]XP_036176224.1 ras-related protein Rab-17 isoform X2 [Myotis myotis]XP_036176225.1 ras-related protein Rab-17 isoform X2 [Myotis myotis]XP_036176226.1 ras-related protein Rab-17 isoform X2 [Myotis myotis]XP_036176227.1 ras-related protein Rab-17 isoform X2 [Myotis myotis]XP_036176228.1 ras-related protein Rab-17 isoform X2 [Myotis myotis]XP_036176229.1 ras-related protein Rab-17 isoform X2 [Myotis myotis]KAF6337335.1 RAB17, member RAS o
MAQADGRPQPGAGQPYVFKLVLLGSGSVGKSSLALRYVKNDFKSILPTVGCAFFTKVVELGDTSLKFEIWDTAGQEKYHSVCHLYFRGANAALLVYDITSKDSFRKAQQWLKDLEREFLPGEVVVMLVGNKTDLSEEREVTFEEGKEFAESQSLLFMETSARLNHQVTEAFSAIVPGGARKLASLRRTTSESPWESFRRGPVSMASPPAPRHRVPVPRPGAPAQPGCSSTLLLPPPRNETGQREQGPGAGQGPPASGSGDRTEQAQREVAVPGEMEWQFSKKN